MENVALVIVVVHKVGVVHPISIVLYLMVVKVNLEYVNKINNSPNSIWFINFVYIALLKLKAK